MTNEEYRARIAELEAQLKESKTTRLRCKVSAKGALQVSGLGRFPLTLYVSQWEKLIPFIPDIKAFLEANRDKFSVKPQAGGGAEPQAV